MNAALLTMIVILLIILSSCHSFADLQVGNTLDPAQDELQVREAIYSFFHAIATGDIDACVRAVNWDRLHAIDMEVAAHLACSDFITSGEGLVVESIKNIHILDSEANATVSYTDPKLSEQTHTQQVRLIRIKGAWRINP